MNEDPLAPASGIVLAVFIGVIIWIALIGVYLAVR